MNPIEKPIYNDTEKPICVIDLIIKLQSIERQYNNPHIKFGQIQCGYEWANALVIFDSNEPKKEKKVNDAEYNDSLCD